MVNFKKYFSVKQSDFLYFVLFLLFCFLLFHWFEVLSLGPTGIHVWRQTDSLSIVQNYYYDNQPFFSPRNNDFRFNKYDITLTEFPVYYYISALWWKLTGENYAVLRILHLSTFILGLWGLFRLAQLYIQNIRFSLLILGGVLSSPILVLYAPSFLPNVPAIGITFYAWYLLVRYYREGNPPTGQAGTKLFIWAIILLTLACLLKITFLFNLIIVLFLSVYILRKDRDKKRFFLHIISCILSISILFCWVSYLALYNRESAAESLFTFFSVFTNPWEEILDIWQNGFAYNWFLLEHKYFWYIYIALFIFNVYKIIKNRHWLLFWIHFLLTGSAIVYFLLFFISFHNHEYYLLDFIPMITMQLLTGFYYLSKFRLLKKYIWAPAILMLISLWISSAHITTCYLDVEKGFNKRQLEAIEKEVSDFNKYYRYDARLRDPLLAYRDTLRNLGINRKDRVICMPDQSPNTMLFYYNLRGISNFHLGWELSNMKQLLEQQQKAGFNYFIYAKNINPPLDSLVIPQLGPSLWQDERISVYRLKPKK